MLNVCVYVYPCEYLSTQRKINTDCIHTYDVKRVIIVRFLLVRFHSSKGMAPYEALYGRKCRTPFIGLFKFGNI